MKTSHEQITPEHVGRTVWVNDHETAVIVGVEDGDVTVMHSNGDHNVYDDDTILLVVPCGHQ
jgi:hypothetical protein